MNELKTVQNQFWLLGFFVMFCGLVFTDNYYGTIGLRRSTFSISVESLVYKGFLLVFADKIILFLYAVSGIFVYLSSRNTVLRFKKIMLTPDTYIVVVLVASIFAGFHQCAKVGTSEAVKNYSTNTSTLRKLVYFHSRDVKKQDYVDSLMGVDGDTLRIVVAESSRIILLHTNSFNSADVRPNLYVVRLGGDDVYVSAGSGRQ
jgi:hypothetical protein